MKKNNKIFLIFIAFISLLFLTSCDEELSSFDFLEGKYISEEYPFVLYDNIFVDHTIIEFSSYEGGSEDLEYNKEGRYEYLGDECEIEGLIQNRSNDKIYQIKLFFKIYNSEEYIHTNVYAVKTVTTGDGSDVYKIRVDIIDVDYKLTYYFRIQLTATYEDYPDHFMSVSLLQMFKNDEYVENIQNTTELEAIKERKAFNLYFSEE